METACILMLTHSPMRRVFARGATPFNQTNVDNEIDGLAAVTLEIDGGLVGSSCIGRIGAARHPEISEIKLRILGAGGALVVSGARPEVSV